jgi:hypothetical protein
MLQLSLDNEVLDDATYLSSLGFSKELQITVQVETKRVNRLYFETVDQKRVIRDFKVTGDLRFVDIAREFPAPTEFVTMFEVDREPLKLSTLVESHIGHPQKPIALIYERASLQIRFHEGTNTWVKSFPVDARTSVLALQKFASVGIDPAKTISRYLILNSRLLTDSAARILKINPDLDPVFLRQAPVVLRSTNLLCLFRYNNITLRRVFPHGITTDQARPEIAKMISADQKLIQFSLDGKFLGPQDPFLDGFEYSIIFESDVRSYEVLLSPTDCVDSHCHPRRTITVDITKQWTVDSLLARFLGDSRSAFPSPVLLAGGAKLPPQFSIQQFASGTPFRIQYHAPPFEGAKYYFAVPGTTHDQKVLVPRARRVLDVKFKLLRDILKKPTVLPRVLRLSFWECELQDDVLLLDYEIPEGARIQCSEREPIRATVAFEKGESIQYLCSEFDQLGDLKEFVSLTVDGATNADS